MSATIVQDELEFNAPTDPRDRHRNLEKLVEITLKCNEDPLVIAAACGVSASALIRALPRQYLCRFVSDANVMTVQEIMLSLAANHALDVAVESIVGTNFDARSRVTMAKDLLDRNSLIGQKKKVNSHRIEMSDASLEKLVELEKVFTESNLQSGQIPAQFSMFHKHLMPKNETAQDSLFDPLSGTWDTPELPNVRDKSK